MITIEESAPLKLSGLTSLHISFPYNADVIAAIKQSNKYAYDKKTYQWEVPITELAYLLDSLTFIDDIKLVLKKEDKNKVHLIPKLSSTYKLPAFEHQLQAIEWGLNTPSGLLLDEAGLGKSATIIHLAEELKVQKGLEHCLIICGINTLKANWKKEIALHSNLSCRVIGEKINSKGKVSYATMKERAAELKNPLDAFFYVINIESIRSDDIIDAIKNSKNKIEMIVLDEAHKCAGTSSEQSHNLLKLKDYAHKIGLTGTLITNNPMSAYIPLKWIGVEKANLTTFKSQYCEFGGFGGYQIVGYKNINLLKDEIDSCSLRRTKSMIKDLPPKTVIKELVEMSDKHKQFYEDVKKGVKEECDKVNLDANNVLSLTTRLRQATSSPSTLTSNPILSSKVERCCDLVDEFVAQGDKVVIMSTFKDPVYVLKDLLKDYHPLIGTGDQKDDEVSKNIDLFQNNPEYKVLICTTSKCGTGLTMNAASYLIMLDTPWTEAMTSQCEDRIHRVNNTKPAFIYRLICANTIDEVVDKIVSTKKAMSDYIVDDKADSKTVEILKNYIQDL